jgi:hypothetical protein
VEFDKDCLVVVIEVQGKMKRVVAQVALQLYGRIEKQIALRY